MVADYLVIGFPHASGNWVVILPDFLGVTGRGQNLEDARRQAFERVTSVVETLMNAAAPLPVPQELGRVQRDPVWSGEYGVDWEQAAVSTIFLPLQQQVPETIAVATPDPGANLPAATLVESSDVPSAEATARAKMEAGELPNPAAVPAEMHNH